MPAVSPDCGLVFHVLCIPNLQATLTGFKCFNSWFFWRAAAAVSLASTSEQCHTLGRAFTPAHPGAHLVLGRCEGAVGRAWCLAGIFSFSASTVIKLTTFQFFCSWFKMLVSVSSWTELAATGEVPSR